MLLSLLIAATTVALAGVGAQASETPVAAAESAIGAADRAGEKVAERGKGKCKRGKGKCKKKRPGCRRFCQQAGGFGGDETPNQPIHFPDQVIGGARDRIVNVKAACTLDTKCVGAILLNGTGKVYEYGRADLKIPAHEEAKVPIGISRKALDSLKEHGDDQVFATVPLVDMTQPVSVSTRMTLLAP